MSELQRERQLLNVRQHTTGGRRHHKEVTARVKMAEAEMLILKGKVGCGGYNLGYRHGFQFQLCYLLAVQT